jgi:hypothetical protein
VLAGGTEATEAAELRRAINVEIANLQRWLKIHPQQAAWMQRRIDELIAWRDAPDGEAAPVEACAESYAMPDLASVPEWARPIVQEHHGRQAADRAETERRAAQTARLSRERAATAYHRASLPAPQMGHMANASGNFALRLPQRLIRMVSTPEQRHIASVREARVHEARVLDAGSRLGGPVEVATAAIPRSSMTGTVVYEDAMHNAAAIAHARLRTVDARSWGKAAGSWDGVTRDLCGPP